MTNQEISQDDILKALLEGLQSCPFHKLLGIQILSLTIGDVCVRIDMRDELIGNTIKGILHGGVISSVLDIAGGIIATASVMEKMSDRPVEEAIQRYLKMGTIDLRVDYLKPGKGKYFLAKGTILRTGESIAVTRMELHNDQNQLVAVGTGCYKAG